MLSRTRIVPVTYNVLGTVIGIIAALTFLNVAAGWHVAGILLLKALGFGLLDVIAAYGFFLRARWLLPAFALNTVGIGTLCALQMMSPIFGVVALIASGGITMFLYFTKSVGKKTPWWLGTSFFVLWILLFILSHYPRA